MADTDMDVHAFCRELLKQNRKEAREAQLVISKLFPWRVSSVNNWYEVRDEKGNMLWQGDCCCGYFAKAQAVGAVIDAAELSKRKVLNDAAKSQRYSGNAL